MISIPLIHLSANAVLSEFDIFHIFINVGVDEATRNSRERRPFKLQLLQIYSATAFFLLNVASVAKLPDPPVSVITRTNNVLFEFNYLLPFFFTVTVTFYIITVVFFNLLVK